MRRTAVAEPRDKAPLAPEHNALVSAR